MQITEVYKDAEGETHLRTRDVDLELHDYAPPSAPVGRSAEMPMTTGVFLEAPPGWDKSFHPSPRRQYAILLSGRAIVTVTDGAVIDVRPGAIVLFSDVDCKGHLTRVQGNQPARFLLVGLADR
jgi:uncharacterized cupin superfamily protein